MQTHLPGRHGLDADPNDDFNCEKPVTRDKMQKNQTDEWSVCVCAYVAFMTFLMN